MKKLATLFTASLFAAMLLTGCGKTAKTAEEVFANFNAKEDRFNMHQEMSMDMGIKISAEGMDINMPVTMDFSADSLDEYTSHGEAEVSMTFLGESQKNDMEFYTEKSGKDEVTVYMNADGDWTVQEMDLSDAASDTGSIAARFELSDRALKNAEFAYDKNTKTYAVTIPLEDIADTVLGETDLGSLADSMGLDDAMEDLYEDAAATYTFDADYNILGITVDDTSFETEMEVEGVTAKVGLELSLSVECSGHGTITEEDVEIPDNVKENAVPSVDITLDDEDVNFSMNGDDTEDLDMEGGLDIDTTGSGEDSLFDDSFYDDAENYEEEENKQPDAEETNAQTPTGSDVYGAYKGIAFSPQGTSFDETFGADGWEFDDDAEDGEYSFVALTNKKYGNYATLYLYNKKRDASTKSEILADGFYGYSIEVDADGPYPDMSFGGVRFGDTKDKVEASYGEPDYTYTGSAIETFTYEFDDYTEMEFQFDIASGKLYSVELSVWQM